MSSTAIKNIIIKRMIRDNVKLKKINADQYFRWRGGEVTRLEGIADGVFAITLTLLIVNSTGVNGFNDVWTLVRDLPALLASFALIMYIWFEHCLFFRRYGLIDSWSLFFNATFLFVIMITAYPLKLLTTFLWYMIIGVSTQPLFEVSGTDITMLSGTQQREYMMYFYGAAIAGVFALLMLMHVNAWSKRKMLALNKHENLITLQAISHHLVSTLIALISIIILWLTKKPWVSGIVYFFNAFVAPFNRFYLR